MKNNGSAAAKWFSALALGISCLAGCSVGGDDDHEESESEAALKGVYRVPVSKGLEPFATYPVEGIEVKRDDGYMKIEYMFPTWLAGELQQVELEGVYTGSEASFAVTAGFMGSGACEVTGSRFVCTENLPGVVVNPGKAKAHMHAAGLTGHEVAQRMLVTEAFSVDPIGIIDFEMP